MSEVAELKPTKRAALYDRDSTKGQSEKGQSIPQQKRKTKEYAEARGWDVLGSWEDPAISGGKTWSQRPAASELRRGKSMLW